MVQPKNNQPNVLETSADELTFRGQRPGERIIFLLHQHPYVLVRTGLLVVGLGLAIAVVYFWVGISLLLSIIILALVPVIIYLAVTVWYRWVNTMYVLTDHRIIAVYQRGWFLRNVAETELENIVSVEHKIEGFAKSILDYGELNIHSSGAAETEILLENVYDPYGVQQKILDFAKQSANPEV